VPKSLVFAEDDPLWYKDAVIYELHVKSFFDGDNDGVGDFRGLIEKLDYLQGLGVTAVWLLPFYPSPLKDDGYDISDYTSIHPSYGTLADFREFLRQAHRRGLRVITELVLNHTSDQHPWFQKSRRGEPGWRDAYVWSDSPDRYQDARVIFRDFESSNWAWDPTAKAYYWHRFYSHQPDLNYDNPGVRKSMLGVLDFWLGLGVDGLRLDAVPYLFEREGTNCENLPETHAFLKEIRRHVDKTHRNRMLLAEANQWAEDALAYFGRGDEAHMAFNFPAMPRMFMAVQMEDRFPIMDIFDPPLTIPDACQWALFLRNHDELTLEMVTDEERDYMYRVYAADPRAKINLGIRRRLAPLLGNNRRKIELLNTLLFSLPGTPIIYYGDEIGMGDNIYLGDRDGVRTPMQWSEDRNAGFSRANPQKLYLPIIIDPEYHYEAVNAGTQERNLSSLYWWTKRVIAMRRKFKAFGRGSIDFLRPRNPKVLAFLRQYREEKILVVANLSRFSQSVEMDLSAHEGAVPEEVFSQNPFPAVGKTPYLLTLGPHDHFWFRLERQEPVRLPTEEVPALSVERNVRELLAGGPNEPFRRALASYLRKCRWYEGKGRTIRELRVMEEISPPKNPGQVWLFLEVRYNEGIPEVYFLPLAWVRRDKLGTVLQTYPQARVADLAVGGEAGALLDAAYLEEFQRLMFDLIARRRKVKGKSGELSGAPGRLLRGILDDAATLSQVSALKGEQSNTSVVYGKRGILKLFRKLEYGTNPDIEIGRALTENAGFAAVPAFMGSLAFSSPGRERLSLGILQAFVPNESDAWVWTLDHVGGFCERALSERKELGPPPARERLFSSEARPDGECALTDLIGGLHLEMTRLLGKRTGELHLALSGLKDVPGFEPEPFSLLYQRSVFQSMRSLTRQVFGLLESNLKGLPPDTATEVSEVLALRDTILASFGLVTAGKIEAVKIRIHGDYHLGQVLFTGKDFVIIDFEGEPARSLSERRLKRSPLRDVAGMIRSFHYAAYFSMLRHPSIRPDDLAFLEPWLRAWHECVSRVFFRSYLDTVRGAPFIPAAPEETAVLFAAYLLEKAVYELGYEINNRPDWLIVPVKGVREALDQFGPGSGKEGG